MTRRCARLRRRVLIVARADRSRLCAEPPPRVGRVRPLAQTQLVPTCFACASLREGGSSRVERRLPR
eukprot:2065672-Pleurochrysis_carterae.AAC.1